jgi:hypothetical protein
MYVFINRLALPAVLLWRNSRNANNLAINLSCFKAYYKPYYPTRGPIVEYHRKNIITKPKNICLYSNSKPGHFLQGCGVCSCSLFAETNNAVLFYQSAENIFTGTRTQDSLFVPVIFVPLVSSPKQIMLVSSMFFNRHYFPSYRKHLHRDLNPGQFFGVVASVPVIYSPKQTPLDLVLFSYRA